MHIFKLCLKLENYKCSSSTYILNATSPLESWDFYVTIHFRQEWRSFLQFLEAWPKQATYTLDMPLYMNHARHELEYQLMGLFYSVDLLICSLSLTFFFFCIYLQLPPHDERGDRKVWCLATPYCNLPMVGIWKKQAHNTKRSS